MFNFTDKSQIPLR